MKIITPNYYVNFKCIADRCNHNCCIGWEIDIDCKTAAYYAQLKGAIGEKLRANIDRKETPHFILGAEDRCPFLWIIYPQRQSRVLPPVFSQGSISVQ